MAGTNRCGFRYAAPIHPLAGVQAHETQKNRCSDMSFHGGRVGGCISSSANLARKVSTRHRAFWPRRHVTTLAACDAEVRAERERWTEYTKIAGIQPE